MLTCGKGRKIHSCVSDEFDKIVLDFSREQYKMIGIENSRKYISWKKNNVCLHVLLALSDSKRLRFPPEISFTNARQFNKSQGVENL